MPKGVEGTHEGWRLELPDANRGWRYGGVEVGGWHPDVHSAVLRCRSNELPDDPAADWIDKVEIGIDMNRQKTQ